MGVPGLTSYVYARQDIYFDKFQLCNTALIIDANSLAAFIYQKNLSRTAHFGGDYDRFGFLIEKLFIVLKSCNVIPIVVFDGGYEPKKYKTICQRNANRVMGLEDVQPGQLNGHSFPLMMRQGFKQKIVSLGVPVVQSDFEADREIAALSQKLNAPVLSNDSDFLIFDVPYLPLPLVDFDSLRFRSSVKYVDCYIFNKAKFLNRFPGLDKNLLPLFATLIGNDYINRTSFNSFFDKIKVSKSPKLSSSQKRIKGLLEWLENKSFDAVMEKVLDCFHATKRKQQKRKIAKIVKGYTDMDTLLLNYIPESVRTKIKEVDGVIAGHNQELTLKDDLRDDIDEGYTDKDDEKNAMEINSENDEDGFDADVTVSSESENDEVYENINEHSDIAPVWLLEMSRKGEITPNILTLLSVKTYFTTPQPENYNLPHAGSVGIPLVQFIGGLVLGETTVKYWSRQRRNKYECSNINTILTGLESIQTPLLENLLKIPLHERKKLFLNKFFVEDMKFLKTFPEDWILFILALIFWVKSSSGLIKPFHIHAVIMMLIAINVIDSKVEFYRTQRMFMKKYGSKIQSLMNIKRKQLKKQEKMTLNEARTIVSKDDCLTVVGSLVPYFYVDDSVRNRKYQSRNFSLPLVHTFNEFQTCIDLAITLNSLLGSPFKIIDLTKLYNSTFLYNMSANLRLRKNILAYIESFFSQSPQILNLYLTIYQALQNFMPSNLSQEIKPKKKKKKSKIPNIVNDTTQIGDTADDEELNFIDKNNKYSLLNQI